MLLATSEYARGAKLHVKYHKMLGCSPDATKKHPVQNMNRDEFKEPHLSLK